MVVIVPVLLALVMLVVQFALWKHATHLVTAAAQRGAAAGQAQHGSVGAARSATDAFLRGGGRGILHRPRVRVHRDRARTRVEVDARVVSLVPGFELSVRGRADGPNERFLAPEER